MGMYIVKFCLVKVKFIIFLNVDNLSNDCYYLIFFMIIISIIASQCKITQLKRNSSRKNSKMSYILISVRW